MFEEQREKLEAREAEFFNEKRALEEKVRQLETGFESATLQKTRVEEQMSVRCEFLQTKLDQAAYDKEVEFKHYMEKI